ncbi:hypothetical protein GTY65_24415 [Streptomyces sp. SID8379]|uniref:hypothetical protein n=1 Tax=unclassified Streptomyces TaxID=2593676 RepID=UPI00036B95A4|nr:MULTISPECIES: hypothetical protein [unclassified Streptomyces]MYW67187.1 hypothetical protein [Streptomyces sp. SID8379]
MTTTLPSPVPLARHYYELRRQVLEAGGVTLTPWYQLSENERAVAVTEGVIILEALERATTEQTLMTDAIRRAGVSPGALA